jgi:hypothetical protein
MDLPLIKGAVAWYWDWLKVMLLDGSVLEEDPLVVLINVNINAALQRKGMKIATF